MSMTTADLFEHSAHFADQGAGGYPQLLLVGDIPYATSVPGEFEPPEDAWFSEGLATERLGTFRGSPVYHFAPNAWNVVDKSALELHYALEHSRLYWEDSFVVPAEDLDRCIILSPHDDLNPEKFDSDTFTIFRLGDAA